MYYLGIDPGKKGAWALLDSTSMKIVDWQAADCPDVGWIDRNHRGYWAYRVRGWHSMHESLALTVQKFDLKPGNVLVLIEQQGTRPKEGRVSAFTGGFGFGVWLGLMGGMGLPYRCALPSLWKTELFRGIGGNGKEPGQKERSIRHAAEMFPEFAEEGLTLGRRHSPHDGLADAACLALWAHKQYGRWPDMLDQIGEEWASDPRPRGSG